MLFRDARDPSDRLLSERDWETAASVYAADREAAVAAVREHDRCQLVLDMAAGEAADCPRERHERAKQDASTLGGWAPIAARGPEGLAPTARLGAAPSVRGEPGGKRRPGFTGVP